MAGEIQAVIFQRVKYRQIGLLAAFFSPGDGSMRRYLTIIGQIIGDALGTLESFKLAELLADVGGSDVLLSSGESVSSLAKSAAVYKLLASDVAYLVQELYG